MKVNRFKNYIFLGVMIFTFAIVISFTTNINLVNAQSPCNDPADPSYPCTPQPSGNDQSTIPPADVPSIRHTKTPTPTATSTQTLTPTQTLTATPTPKSTNFPISGGVAESNNPSSELPAVQNPDSGSSPSNFPGPLGWIIPAVIVVIGAAVGLTLVRRKRKIGSTSNTDLLPAIQKGGNESATLTIHDGLDLGGGKESATMTVHDGAELGGGKESATISIHDVGDVAPDVAPDGALNAREAANDPGGVHSKPPTPNKLPNPNLGNKSGGGTQ